MASACAPARNPISARASRVLAGVTGRLGFDGGASAGGEVPSAECYPLQGAPSLSRPLDHLVIAGQLSGIHGAAEVRDAAEAHRAPRAGNAVGRGEDAVGAEADEGAFRVDGEGRDVFVEALPGPRVE